MPTPPQECQPVPPADLLVVAVALLLLHDGAIVLLIGLVPGALRLSRVQLVPKPRERSEDDEAKVCLDTKVTCGPAALRQNRAVAEGPQSDRSESLGESDCA